MMLTLSLICTLVVVVFFIMYILKKIKKEKNSNVILKDFLYLFISILIQIFGITLQAVLLNIINIEPVYYEYVSYLGGVFMPVFLLIVSIHYYNEKFDVKKIWWIFILPIVTIILLWTNNLHHLFYVKYSTIISKTIFGKYFSMYSMYSYLCMGVSVFLLLKTSLRKSGFFSKQTLLFVIGIMIPLIPNILATFKLISMSVQITPILFSITTILFALSIIKYKALNITPVAFRTVMDTMSDAYVVISDDGTIVTFNKTFENKFGKIFNASNDDNLFEKIEKDKSINIDKLKNNIKKTREKGKVVTEEYHFLGKNFNKYFEVDIHPIATKTNSKEYVGTLLLFKDITQHKEDIKEIEEKQDVIVKQQQLVSIGELAGGVAHDINTPIAAIRTGIVLLKDMGAERRTEEELEVLQRMDNCATKIINIVNSMRNQIRNLGSDTNVKFKISEVVNDIKIITYHEVGRNKSEVVVNIADDLEIKGDPTKLGQVLTNLVVNAAQAYGPEKGGKIEITVEKAPSNMAMIKVADYAGGLSDNIIPYVFKNILTTKGTAGTGLGLYLAYSVIKGNFNGNITFDTAKGEGTTFYIVIPRA